MAYQSQSAASFEELCAFVAVVDAKGFSAAARATGGRKATFSQRVQALESRLGVPLLVRTTRSLRLTDEGRGYYVHARRSLAAAQDAEAIVLAAKSEPSGQLRVTTTAALASGVLDHVVMRYLVLYPKTTVHVDTSDARLELVQEDFDLAIRVGALADSSLIARKLGVMHTGYFVSPDYLIARGVPDHPEQLTRHDVIVTPRDQGPAEWSFLVGGKPRGYRVRPRLAVASVELAVKAGLAGLGVVGAPLHMVVHHVAARRLIPVLREWVLPPLEVHAVFPPTGALVPKTRVFLDLLTTWFQKQARRSR
ncbi:MAG: LysR family transcriptional regulator [Polyangiales bacterium]